MCARNVCYKILFMHLSLRGGQLQADVAIYSSELVKDRINIEICNLLLAGSFFSLNTPAAY